MKKTLSIILILALFFSIFPISDSFAQSGSQVTADAKLGLNLRSSTSTSSTIIAKIPYRTVLSVLADYGTWLKVSYNGKTGFVSKQYTKPVGSSVTAPVSTTTLSLGTIQITAPDGLNVRSAMNLTSTILTKIPYGTKVQYISKSGRYYKVSYAGKTGYVYDYYTKVVSEAQPTQPVSTTAKGTILITSTDGLNVRSSASLSSAILTSIPYNVKVSYLQKVGRYYQVSYNGKVGYVYDYYTKVVTSTTSAPAPEKTVGTIQITSPDGLNIRSSMTTSSSKVGSIPYGTKVSFTSYQNRWYRVSYNGKVGYVYDYYTKVVSEATPVAPITTAPLGSLQITARDGLNIRSSASTSSAIIATIPFNGTVSYLKVLGSWYQVTYNGKTGYIYNYYTKQIPTTVTKPPTQDGSIPANNDHTFTTNQHSMTLDQFAAAEFAKGGNTVQKNGNWVNATQQQVKDALDPNKILGYDMTANHDKTGQTTGVGYVTVNGLNVRSKPDTSSVSLGIVNTGQRFDIYDKFNGWYQIRYANQVAWVNANYINFVAKASQSYPVGSIIKVTSPTGLNIRSSASTSSRSLALASQGEVFVVLQTTSGWVKVSRNGTIGWIYTAYTSTGTPTQNAQPTQQIPKEMYQFLDLKDYTGLTSQELNSKVLAGKGILEGQGQAFIDGSMKYNINEIYLISHAFLETGNGTSRLATGMYYDPRTGKASSTPVGDGKKYYNVYGIGAIDSDPLNGGTRAAYENGWDTPAKAISGGAAWISKNYINNDKFQQNTLYKMRWNYEQMYHQYATDVTWASAQTKTMSNLYNLVNNFTFRFEVPVYANRILWE